MMKILPVEEITHAAPEAARLAHEGQFAEGIAHVNGRYMPLSEASVPLFDAGFVHSDVVYEKATVAPGGHLELPHPWPGQTPPLDSGETIG